MITEEIINGKIFVAQTTYYVYANVGDRVANKPTVTTSDILYYARMKEYERHNPTPPVTQGEQTL